MSEKQTVKFAWKAYLSELEIKKANAWTKMSDKISAGIVKVFLVGTIALSILKVLTGR